MSGVIEIRSPGRNVVLHDLLSMLKEEGPNLVWSILDFEAVAKDEEPVNVLEIEREVQEAPNGLILEWPDLLTLAESLFDVWNILIAAAPDALSIPKIHYGAEEFGPWEFGPCEIVVEVFDSTYCRVYARNDAIIRRLEARYQDVRVSEL